LVPKGDYRKRKFSGLLTQYFDNSIENMVSFLIKEKKLSPKEIDKLTRMISRESEDSEKYERE
jgi:predicted transcriptional regulator